MKVSDVAMDGTWVRCSQYIIDAQGLVRPAHGASLERYSLFEAIQASQSESRANTPGICEELANLDFYDNVAILAFVHKWGLLGILPHKLEYAEFANGAIWHQNRTGWTFELRLVPGTKFEVPEGSRWEMISHRGLPPGRALVCSDDGSTRELRDDISQVLAPHFPDGPLRGGYPIPVDDEFWLHYSESVHDISRVAWSLRIAMDQMANFQELRKRGILPEHSTMPTARTWISGNAKLHPSTGLTDTKETLSTLHASSLIAAIATMLWMDFGSQKFVKTCTRKGCGKLFITRLHSSEYCSDQCKKAAQNTRNYERRKARQQSGQ